ncbi:MAG: Cd(II)/Pb(II)-responsive transcriptional regulator [Rhodocyclaceae bacterium]|nr:MAG: Cd(II)/Pb(II)-responsive transcriptional regulator [Rhodocyclaceae bacterium]
MRIGELGWATGVDVETIRYYEKAGLLPVPARQANGYRDYGDKHLERLAFIRHCRVLDLPLVEIKRLLELLSEPSAACDDVDHLIEGQLERVRTRIRSLRALERQLCVLRSCCAAPQTAAECGILHELVTSAHHEAIAINRAGR